MAAAHGGQTVASAATVALCPGGAFRDAGRHVLRGVGPERLYVADDGTGDTRPVRAGGAAPSNLVPDASSFVGRHRDVKDLAELITSHPLVTLVGPGGVGKTRLAVETAATLADAFEGGIWLCELAPLSHGEQVAAAVADAVGARPQAGMDLAAALALFLSGRRSLVILDNCEHVLNDAAQLAKRLADTPGTTVLATSRELLGVRGEQLWPVEPLDAASAAAELFVHRARERDPHFELDRAGEGAVTELCRRLDGLPLAVELAAARTNVLSPEAILRRLHDRFSLLRGSGRGSTARTLRDTVTWSYELLSPGEQRLFERLSVFAGSFTLDAAEAVCADEGIGDDAVDFVQATDILDLTAGLVEKSMVQRDRSRTDRFLVLETLRHFGHDQLHTRGETDLWADRHAAYFAEMAVEADARIFGPDEVEVWAVFDAEWDNLRAAFARLLDRDEVSRAAELVTGVYFFACYAMRYEAGDWARQLLARAHLDEPHRARVEGVWAWAAWSTGDPAGAVALFEAAAARARIEPAYWFTCIIAFLHLGGREAAHRAATTLATGAAPVDVRSSYCATIVQPYSPLGQRLEGPSPLDFADRALEQAQRAGCPSAIAHAHHVRAIALRDDPVASVAASRTALAHATAVHPDHIIADGALQTISHVTCLTADIGQALGDSRAAVASSAGYRYLGDLAPALQGAAIALHRAGDMAVASQVLATLRSEGYRLWRRAEAHINLEPASSTGYPPRYGSLLEAAEAVLAAIDDALGSRIDRHAG